MVADDGARPPRFRPFRPEDVDGIWSCFSPPSGTAGRICRSAFRPAITSSGKLSSPDAQRRAGARAGDQRPDLAVRDEGAADGVGEGAESPVEDAGGRCRSPGSAGARPDAGGPGSRGVDEGGGRGADQRPARVDACAAPAFTGATRRAGGGGERGALAGAAALVLGSVGASGAGGDAPGAFARAARASVRFAASGARSRPAPEAAAGLTFREVERFDRRLDELWERARTEFDFALVRDSRALNWRYCDPRAGV